jgi:hypothetical protein
VNFDTYRDVDEVPVAGLLGDLALEDEQDQEADDQDIKEEQIAGNPDIEEVDNPEEDQENNTDTNYVECFKIVGSHWEQRYQDSLEICYNLSVNGQKADVRAEPDPNNIRDTNAIKFEVYHNGLWHIIGYCGVKKIPKLKRALERNSVVSIVI